MHARQLALTADIVITNHSMLLIDTEHEKSLLPDYHFVIIDEAHNFGKAARKCFGQKFEYNAFKFMIGRLGSLDKKHLLFKLDKMIKQRELTPNIHSLDLDRTITELDAEIDDFFMLISKMIVHHHRKKTTKNIKQQLRITDEMRSDVNWMPIVTCAERLLDYHRKISSGIENRLELLKNHDLKLEEADRAFIEEVNSFAQDWHHFGNKLTHFILNPSNQDVIWVEGDIRALPNSVGLFAEPENPGLMLSERFFNNKKSVVMTSANTFCQLFL